MNRKKELVFNTIIIALGNFSTKILSILLLPLYTSLLTTEEYGTYDLIITIVAFLTPIVTLLMEESMFRFLIDCNDEKDKKNIISQTFTYIMISTVVVSGIIFCLFPVFGIENIIFLIIYMISTVMSGLKNALTRGLGKIKLYSLSSFISGALTLILNIIFIVVLKTGYRGLLFSSIITNITISAIILFRLKIYKYISFRRYNKTTMKEMLKYSIPLVPNSISWGIINLSDRFIISSSLGTSANGIYSIANKFPTFLDTMYSFFYTAWKESAAKAMKDDNKEQFYIYIYNNLNKILITITIGIIAYLPVFFSMLIKKEFGLAYQYIPILLIAMYYTNISGFYGGIFSAYKNTKIMGTTTIIAAVINLIINILLVNAIGVWAAAISTLISAIIVYIIRRIKIKEYIQLKENKMVLPYIMLIFSIISYYINNNMINIITLFIITISIILYNIDLIKKAKTLIIRNKKQ